MSDKSPSSHSDDSESEEEDIPHALYKELDEQLSKIVKDIEKVGKGSYTLFDKPFKKDTKVTDITKEYALGLKHILMDEKCIKSAKQFVEKIEQYQEDCEYGDTQCNNDIWDSFMLPAVEKTLKQLNKKQWTEGFIGLFGMFLFMKTNDGHWIHDQEIYLEEKVFTSFFKKYSKAWKLYLAQDDDVIGLKFPGGLPGGYREILIDLLREQQNDTNDNVLEDIHEHCPAAKINIIHKKKKQSDFNEENKLFLMSASKENQNEKPSIAENDGSSKKEES